MVNHYCIIHTSFQALFAQACAADKKSRQMAAAVKTLVFSPLKRGIVISH
jgi:hypothetical protein